MRLQVYKFILLFALRSAVSIELVITLCRTVTGLLLILTTMPHLGCQVWHFNANFTFFEVVWHIKNKEKCQTQFCVFVAFFWFPRYSNSILIFVF